jgi:hypothetical protein
VLYPWQNQQKARAELMPVILGLKSDALAFEPHHQIISPAKAAWLAQLTQKYLMADQQQPSTQDPPIYKHLSPKTQGFLRASSKQREEAARLNADTMSNEQT